VRDSPLSLVTDDPLLRQFIEYLDHVRRQVEAEGGAVLELHGSRLAEVHHAFRRMVRSGEERLHRLARLLAREVYDGDFDLRSVVVGEVAATGERFLLQQALEERLLFGLTDLDLGQRLLSRVKFRAGDDLSEVGLVANAVEYLPRTENALGVHKVISRIKAEEELWNKVVDELFGLDAIVRRDKELRPLSRYVKDVFGLKFVVGSVAQVPAVHERLVGRSWTRSELGSAGVPLGDDVYRLEVLETKDHLSLRTRKGSGWTAIKSVARWWGTTFELQIQPLRNYYRERERVTRESHDQHKGRRDALRDEVAARLPLFGFYRDLLRWAFGGRTGPPPSHPGVVLRVD